MSYYLIKHEGYLQHYGIKGQKWGLRRYQNPDGSLTPAGKEHYGLTNGKGNEKLASAYAKESKKLKKLSERADVEVQKTRAEKFEKRSKNAKRLGNAAAAAVLPALGISSLSDAGNRQKILDLNNNLDYVSYVRSKGLKMKTDTPWDAINWFSPEDAKKIRYATFHSPIDKNFAAPRKGDSIAGAVAKGVAIGAGAVAAGAYATAAASKIISKNAQRRTTEIGHAKAVAKYQKQVDKMTKMFADTPYADLMKK